MCLFTLRYGFLNRQKLVRQWISEVQHRALSLCLQTSSALSMASADSWRVLCCCRVKLLLPMQSVAAAGH